MGWMGKIVGGAIGFAMGGPLGAVAGSVFGHAYDKSGEMDIQGHRPLYLSTEEQAQVTFFVAAFSMLAELVKSDGRISPEEIDSIEKIMAHDLGLDSRGRQMAVNIFNTALESSETFQDYATQFYNRFHMKPQLLEFMLDILFKVSLADGNLSPAEEELIRSASAIFQFGAPRYEAIKSRYVRMTDKYYDVLGCTEKDSNEKIKSQYRKMVREFHPDTIAAKGLPEEFTVFAQDKFRQIQEAYEAIKARRGIK